MFVEHKEIGEVQEAPAKVLKLSEAMRIGAKMRKQGFGGVLHQRQMNTSCALLAAYEAVNGYPKENEDFVSCDLSDWAAPLCPRGIRAEIVELNDLRGWSRDRIADWVEALGY